MKGDYQNTAHTYLSSSSKNIIYSSKASNLNFFNMLCEHMKIVGIWSFGAIFNNLWWRRTNISCFRLITNHVSNCFHVKVNIHGNWANMLEIRPPLQHCIYCNKNDKNSSSQEEHKFSRWMRKLLLWRNEINYCLELFKLVWNQ